MRAGKVSAIVSAAVLFAVGLLILSLAVSSGRADHAPQYRVDGAVIYGDWGLYRPGHVAPWVHGPQVVGAGRYGMGHYFPSNRDDPGAYRRRPPVDRAPIPAEPYYRSWGAQSAPYDASKATDYAPFDPPAVIYAPSEPRPRRKN
jgi:hypothetical protein